MATPTFVSTLTTINNADAVVNNDWATFTTPDPDIKKEGTNALSGILRNDLSTGTYTSPTSINITNQHIRLWVQYAAIAFLDTFANGGIEFFISDGTNTAYWTIFGSDTYSGGWFNAIVDYSSTPTSGTKPAGNVTIFGLRFNRTGQPRQVVNTWVDYLRYGDGYQVTGGTSLDPLFITDITAYDALNGTILRNNGITIRENGVNFMYGRLIFGNGATTTYVEIENEVLIFTESPVSATLYQFKAVGSGCTLLVSNSVIKSSGTNLNSRFLLDMSDAGLASFSLTGSSIVRANQAIFKSGQTISATAFARCGPVFPKGSTFTNNTISDSTETTGGALVIDSESDIANMADCIFDGNSVAIEITTSGTYTFNGHQFTNNTTQVDFSGSGTCTIVPTNGSNVTQANVTASGGGTIIVQAASYDFRVTNVVANTEIRIIRQSDLLELGGAEDVGNATPETSNTVISIDPDDSTKYVVTYSYPYTTDIPIFVVAHSLQFQWLRSKVTLKAENSSLKIAQIADRQYLNP